MDILYRISHIPFLPSNNSLCLLVSEENIFKSQPRKCPCRSCFLSKQVEMRISCRGPAIDAYCKILIGLDKQFLRRRNLEIDQTEKELPMAVMFVNTSRRNEQSFKISFHRCFIYSFSSPGQAVSEKKILRYRPIRNMSAMFVNRLGRNMKSL